MDETIAAGQMFAERLKAGDIVALVGELGAGKTHFSQGLITALGAQDTVSSPTFSLVNEYQGAKAFIAHFDFYRLDDIRELERIGWDDYLESGSILIVEWADRFPEAFPKGTHWIEIQHKNDGREWFLYEEIPVI